MATRCTKCGLQGVEISHDGTATCSFCGFVADGDPIDSRFEWNSTGEQVGTITDGSRPRLQKAGPYDPKQVADDNRRYSRQVLREVATALRMSQHEEIMWGYFERAVGQQWGKGEWVRVWSAAVAHIVARTRRIQATLSINDIATCLNIKLRHLYAEFRTVVGFLRVRQVLEDAAVSELGTKILLENVNVHNGEIFALKVRELEGLGVPGDDIQKVVDASSNPAATGERTRFPLPDDGVDPRDLIERLIKRIVPDNCFRDNPVTGSSMVVNLRNACFWLLTVAIRASLHTGRRQEPLAAAAIILAAESVGLRAPGRKFALVMNVSSNDIVDAQPAACSHETLDMSTIATRLGVAEHTVRGRYRELRGCALKQVRSFPWGESVEDRSLNDYLRMLVETEESLSQKEARHRAARRVSSTTAPGSSGVIAAVPGASDAIDFRGDCGPSLSSLTSGHTSTSTAMLPPAFLVNKKRRDELTTRVKAAQARLSCTLSRISNETELDSSRLINQSEHPESTSEDNRKAAHTAADLRTSKRRRTDHQLVASDLLADGNMTRTRSASASGNAELLSSLDDEDLAVERQLLAGVPAADIIAGSIEGRYAAQHDATRSIDQRQAAVEGRVNNHSRTQSRPTSILGSSDLSDDQLRPGGEFLRSEAEVAVLKRWMA